MAIYYILLLFIAVFGAFFCDILPFKHGKTIYALLSTAALTFIAGFRFLTGHDYAGYLPIFTQSAFYDWEQFTSQRYEKGYYVFNKMLSTISIEPYILFMVFGFIFAASIVFYCYLYSSNIWLSLVAFVSFGLLYNSFCFMRQFTAMCILMWALRDVKEKRPLRFLVLVLFASCFHISALIFIPFYIVFQIPINRIVLLIYLAISGFCYAFSVPLILFVTKFFYSKYKIKPGSELALQTNIYVFIGFAILLALCLLFRKDLIKRRKFNDILISCLFFGTFFEFIGTKHAIISRVAVLFMTPAIILLVPELANAISAVIHKLLVKLSKSRKRYAYRSYIAACLLLMIPMIAFNAYLLKINYNGVVPYRTLAEYYGIWGESWTD